MNQSSSPSEEPTEVTRALGALLPPGVAFAGHSAGLPRDRPALGHKLSVTGRKLAVALLTDWNASQICVGRGARGEPIWPDGFLGSISHARDVCVVALARTTTLRSIGIDVEVAQDVDDSLFELICSPEETLAPLGWYFSAKESVFKCQYPLTGEEAEFTDCRIIWEPEGRFRVDVEEERFAVCRSFQGAAVQIGPYVVSCAWLP